MVGLTVGIPLGITAISAVTVVATTNYKKQYSAQTIAVAEKLAEMNKHPRCTSDLSHWWNLIEVRYFIYKEGLKAGVMPKDFGMDSYGNMWFDVKATEGCENWEPLILQGHMDMVVTGLPEDKKETTPIDTVIDWKNGIMHSKDYKTTLGADDGAGISMILTLIQDPSVKHGPLRVFCSADEDSGMIGAGAIYEEYAGKPNPFTKMGSNFDGTPINYLLNIDAEKLGEIYTSCAGSITYKYEEEFNLPAEEKLPYTYSIDVKDLKGGHSGDALVQNRASAEKMIYEILNELKSKYHFQIVKHYHPSKDGDKSFQRNAIVSHARIVFNTDLSDKNVISKVINHKIGVWQKIYTGDVIDQNTITLVNDDTDNTKFLPQTESMGIINALGPNQTPTTSDIDHLWYGYISDGQGGYTKSANISPVEVKYDSTLNKMTAKIHSQTRTRGTKNFDELEKSYMNFSINDKPLFKSSRYKPWELDPNNKMVEVVDKAYQALGVKPEKYASTGGVEPTWWIQMNPNLHCSCIGPTITEAHGVHETLHLKTIQPVLDCIKQVFLAMEKLN